MSGMTRSERDDLQRLVRQREKVRKSAAKQRSAELLADFENSHSPPRRRPKRTNEKGGP
jgi:hypothetical protein